jgi:fibronectin type 3 domain-containing protein
VDRQEFIDRTASYGKPYSYSVQAFAGTAESARTPLVTVIPRDTFPPAPPTGLNAIAGLNSIELTWERSPEADLGGYRVYRAEAAGDFKLTADAVEGPAYSDKAISRGTRYRYSVTAVDQAGNESPRSPVVDITVP